MVNPWDNEPVSKAEPRLRVRKGSANKSGCLRTGEYTIRARKLARLNLIICNYSKYDRPETDCINSTKSNRTTTLIRVHESWANEHLNRSAYLVFLKMRIRFVKFINRLILEWRSNGGSLASSPSSANLLSATLAYFIQSGFPQRTESGAESLTQLVPGPNRSRFQSGEPAESLPSERARELLDKQLFIMSDINAHGLEMSDVFF